MTTRDKSPPIGAPRADARPFLETLRQRLGPSAPDAPGAEGQVFGRGELDYFSAARLYITFKVQQAEHFPEGVPSDTFDFLVDLMIHEWLAHRRGATQAAPQGMKRAATLTPRIQQALRLGFIMIAPDAEDDARCHITLTDTGRRRLSVFFDYMAGYIAVL